MAGRIAVAMSGGVDSSVAALLLKKQGLSLVGVFMHNWDELDERGQCSSEEDYRQVASVCKHIGIPCTRVEFVKEYWNEVFSQVVSRYQMGHTPNPDMLCNERIKFGVFYRHCMSSLGVAAMATGHYARVEHSVEGSRLLQAADPSKDQTYFLSQVSQEALQKTLFPIGHLRKDEVRRIAYEAGLTTAANRKESMGLCFVGKRKFSNFLKEYVEDKPGTFVSLDGRIVGHHSGQHLFTIGQRARIGGQAKRWFVAGKDPHHNIVIVAEGSLHPALFSLSFTTTNPNWIVPSYNFKWPMKCQTRCGHHQGLRDCVVNVLEEGREHGLLVQMAATRRAIAPGQYAVFYDSEVCLGGACISSTDPSH